MSEHRSMGPGRLAWGLALASALVGAGACSLISEPTSRPEEARIRVDGTAPGPLRLVVSTDFSQARDEEGQVYQVFHEADTLHIEPPYDQTVLLPEGNVVVELTNPADEPAEVRLRVDIDTDRDSYDQTATMSEGGTLRYTYTFKKF